MNTKWAVIALLASVAPSAALAQASIPPEASTEGNDETSQAPAKTEGGVEEIIVTAQRRKERLQSVPVSVVAITASRLEAAGVTSTQDLQVLVPGLVMPNVRNTTTPYLRGVGTQSGTAGTEGAVAVYVDGVYLPSAVSTVFSLNNIERVEVLKGPQGTLFGRNATGGLIQVITRDPKQEPEVRLSASYASYDTFTGAFYGTTGLGEGVSADLALYGTYQGDGWGRNLALNYDVGLRREMTARTKFKFDLSEHATLVLAGDYNRGRSDIGNVRTITEGSVAFRGIRKPGGDYDVLTGQRQLDRDSEQYGGSAVLDLALSDNVDFRSTSAYRKLKVFSLTDTDSTPAVLADFELNEVGRSIQQEFLVNGNSGNLRWTAGAFYFNNRAGWDPLSVFSTPRNPANADRYSRINTRSYAAFGQGTYEILPNTNLTLGARYTYDRSSIQGRFIATPGNPAPVGTVTFDTTNLPETQTNRSWDAVTWRAAVDHQFSDDVLVYASFNRGFKSGSFNATAPNEPAVNPEKLDAYEIGFKSDLFDRTVRFNVAGFYYDYTDIQLQRVTGTGTTSFNASGGKLKGVDVELAWAPRLSTGQLNLSAAGSFLDANYKAFTNAPLSTPRNPAVPPFGGNIISPGDASGNRMIKAPKVSYSLDADYSMPVSTKLEVGAHATWQHSSKFYWEVDNRLVQPAFDVVNAQVYFGPPDDQWKVRLWTKNLFDERYVIYSTTSNFTDASVYAAPRTIGVTVETRFGG